MNGRVSDRLVALNCKNIWINELSVAPISTLIHRLVTTLRASITFEDCSPNVSVDQFRWVKTSTAFMEASYITIKPHLFHLYHMSHSIVEHPVWEALHWRDIQCSDVLLSFGQNGFVHFFPVAANFPSGFHSVISSLSCSTLISFSAFRKDCQGLSCTEMLIVTSSVRHTIDRLCVYRFCSWHEDLLAAKGAWGWGVQSWRFGVSDFRKESWV